MIAVDFAYDGHMLSDFGFMICEFDNKGGVNTSGTGSEINFTTVAKHHGQRYSMNNAMFDSCLSTTFQICKNPCVNTENTDMEITTAEFRDLMHWLNRRSFRPLRFYEDENNYGCFYDASFNAKKILVDGVLCGVELTATTNRPFGYGEEIIQTFTDASFTVDDVNDDVGYFYPDMVITCNETGDLEIENETAGCVMRIKNCSANEVITINGDAMTIASSDSNHDIANDFNYDFFKLQNTYDETENEIAVSLDCEIVIKYKPIIKEFP